MSEGIHIIFDCSGSMRENGKGDAAGSALRTLRTWAGSGEYCGYDIRFYRWNDRITALAEQTGLTMRGGAEPSALEGFLRALPPGDRVMLLSDGLFPAGSAQRIIRERGLLFLPVAVGADADPGALKELSSAEEVNPDALKTLPPVRRIYNVSQLAGVLSRLCRMKPAEVAR